MGRKPFSPETARERFWSSVKETPKGCWEWQGRRMDAGYGRVWYLGKHWLTHRLSYALKVGEILHGDLVCHTCDNPPCCNPAHLYAGTYQANSNDRDSRGRGNWTRGEKHHNAKLTEADVLKIRALYQERKRGRGCGALARMFKVTKLTITRIVKNHAWKVVTKAGL